MPRPMTAPEREAFLAEPRVAVLSVAGEGGDPPLASPCFYAYAGGEVTFFTNTERRRALKARHIAREGRVSLTVQRPEPPYRYVTVECAITAAGPPPSAEAVAAIARRYMPEEHAQGLAAAELSDPEGRMLFYVARPERWRTADFSEAS